MLRVRPGGGQAAVRLPAAGLLSTSVLLLALAAGCVPRAAPPGPAAAEPGAVTARLTDRFFITRDGLELPLHRWVPAPGADGRPAPRPVAVVIGLHGFNDYGGAFGLPAPRLAARGVLTYSYDQRGFGGAPDRGLFAPPALLIQDITDIAALLRRRHPGLPVYLVGISMGGAVALSALSGAAPPDVDGAVLVAPAVWARRTMPVYQPAALWIAAHTLPWLTLTGRGIKVRPSDNREMLIAMSRNPMVLKQTRVDAIWGLANLMDQALAAAPRVTAPLLILYGEKDDLVPRAPTRALVAALPRLDGRHQRLALYRGAYHMLLRGLDADRVIGDVAAWLADPTRDALPSGADRTDSFLDTDRDRGTD